MLVYGGLTFYKLLKYGDLLIAELEIIRDKPDCSDIHELMPYEDTKFMEILSSTKFVKQLILGMETLTDKLNVFDTIATKLKFKIESSLIFKCVHEIGNYHPSESETALRAVSWLRKLKKYIIKDDIWECFYIKTYDELIHIDMPELIEYLDGDINISELLLKPLDYIETLAKFANLYKKRFVIDDFTVMRFVSVGVDLSGISGIMKIVKIEFKTIFSVLYNILTLNELPEISNQLKLEWSRMNGHEGCMSEIIDKYESSKHKKFRDLLVKLVNVDVFKKCNKTIIRTDFIELFMSASERKQVINKCLDGSVRFDSENVKLEMLKLANIYNSFSHKLKVGLGFVSMIPIPGILRKSLSDITFTYA